MPIDPTLLAGLSTFETDGPVEMFDMRATWWCRHCGKPVLADHNGRSFGPGGEFGGPAHTVVATYTMVLRAPNPHADAVVTVASDGV